MTKVKSLMGDDADVAEFVAVGKKIGLSQNRFDSMVETIHEAAKGDDAKWQEEVAKALGETKFDDVEKQIRTLSGKDNITLKGVHPAVLSAMAEINKRAIASGLKPPTTNDPAPTPTYDSRFVMDVNGSKVGISLEGDANARVASINAFYNAKVKVPGKDGVEVEIPLSKHDPSTHKRIYRDALSEHGARIAQGQ